MKTRTQCLLMLAFGMALGSCSRPEGFSSYSEHSYQTAHIRDEPHYRWTVFRLGTGSSGGRAGLLGAVFTEGRFKITGSSSSCTAGTRTWGVRLSVWDESGDDLSFDGLKEGAQIYIDNQGNRHNVDGFLSLPQMDGTWQTQPPTFDLARFPHLKHVADAYEAHRKATKEAH